MRRIQHNKILHENEVKKNIPRGKKKKGRRVTMKMGQEIRDMMKDLADQSMGDREDTCDLTTEEQDEEEMLLYVDGIDHDIPEMDYTYDNNGGVEWFDLLNSDEEHSPSQDSNKVEQDKEVEKEVERGNSALDVSNKKDIGEGKEFGHDQKQKQGQGEGQGQGLVQGLGRGQGYGQVQGQGQGQVQGQGIVDDNSLKDSCPLAEGLYRVINDDWMEEFKSVWKMQCVLR